MDNEQEWRNRIFTQMDAIEGKVDKIKDEMTTLKVKVAVFSSFVGSIATLIANKLFNIN